MPSIKDQLETYSQQGYLVIPNALEAVDVDAIHGLIEAVVEALGKLQILGRAAGVGAIHHPVEVLHRQHQLPRSITRHGLRGVDHQSGCGEEPVQGAAETR